MASKSDRLLGSLQSFSANLEQFGLGSPFIEKDKPLLEEFSLVSDILLCPKIATSFALEGKLNSCIDFDQTPLFGIPLNADIWGITYALFILASTTKLIKLAVTERLKLTDDQIKMIFGRTIYRDEDGLNTETVIEWNVVKVLISSLEQAAAIEIIKLELPHKGLSPDFIRLPFIEKFAEQP